MSEHAMSNFGRMPPVNPDTTQYHVKSFRWADTEYTPRQLEGLYTRRLPFLVMTTRGYMGRNAENAAAADEIYWLKEIIKQTRIVVRNEANKFYSIPLHYPQKVVAMKENDDEATEGQPMSIQDLVNKNKKKPVAFCFVEGNGMSRQNVYQGANDGANIDIGKLEVVDRYDEHYLVVHSIIAGSLRHEASIIPLYMPINLVIAVGMARGDRKEFYETMLKMKAYIDSIPKAMANPTQLQHTEILVYEEELKEGEYDNIEPKGYICLQRPTQNEPDNSLYATLFEPGAHGAGHNESSTDGAASPSVSALARELGQKLGQGKESTKTRSRYGSSSKKKKNNDTGTDDNQDAVIETQLNQDNRGGTRGPTTDIACKQSSQGFHISDRHPDAVLAELCIVLQTGVVPDESGISSDQWTDSEGEGDTRKSHIFSTKSNYELSGQNHYSPDPVRRPSSHSFAHLSPPTSNTVTEPEIPDARPPRPERKGTLPKDHVHSYPATLHAASSEPINVNTTAAPIAESAPPAVPKPPALHPWAQSRSSSADTDLGYHSPRSRRNPPPVKPKPTTRAQSMDASENIGMLAVAAAEAVSRGFGEPHRRPTEIRSLVDIPEDISRLNFSDVARCLTLLNLEQFADIFKAQQIDGALLIAMDAEMLMSEFNFSQFQAMKLMRFVQGGWRPSNT